MSLLHLTSPPHVPSLCTAQRAQVIPFVLGHFAGGADARRLTELLGASRAASGMPQTMLRVGMDRQYTVIHVDKPLHEKVRCLVCVWGGDAAGTECNTF